MNSHAESVEFFHDSLRRCQSDRLFIKRFYAAFMQSDPRVASYFAHTDMHRQEMMLQASLHMVMLASQDNGAADLYLRQVAREHQHRQIATELFDIWLECLIATVASTDPRYTPAVEQAWRDIMSMGIQFMKAHGSAAASD